VSKRNYVCQRKNRPIIAVDCLEEFEDRRFPYASNISGIHVHLNNDDQVEKKDIFRILIAALLETVRFYYSKMLLQNYQHSGWIPSNATILSRPPEFHDINQFINDKEQIPLNKEFCYPEPPIYDDELDFLNNIGIKSYTPLNNNLSTNLKSMKIGISISDPTAYELMQIGQSFSHLIQLSQDIARYLIAKEATLVYGGDLRKGGFY